MPITQSQITEMVNSMHASGASTNEVYDALASLETTETIFDPSVKRIEDMEPDDIDLA